MFQADRCGHRLTFESDSPLREIGRFCFESSEIESICVLQTVGFIDATCFASSSHLQVVIFEPGSRLRGIRQAAFAKSGLVSISIPPHVQTIGGLAFSHTTLSTILFEGDIAVVPPRLFKRSSLRRIVIPRSVTVLGTRAFRHCVSFQEVRFEQDSNLRLMESQCFAGSSLPMIRIPAPVSEIGCGCFEALTRGLTIAFASLYLLAEFPNSCFAKSHLEAITLPPSVERLGDLCFSGCSRLTRIDFGCTLRTIGCQRFVGCGLTSARVPKNVESIGPSCFANPTALELFDFDDDSHLTTIGPNCFSCSLLKLFPVPKRHGLMKGNFFNGEAD
jgi:hypothetical protein